MNPDTPTGTPTEATGYDGYTVDQLVEATAELNDRVDALFDRLGRIESVACEEGVEVRVNLEGRLIGLSLTPSALDQPPAALAEEIFRLTQEASAEALADGLAALEPVVGEELAAELAELVATRPRARPPAAPEPGRHTLDDVDDFSEVGSWALPH